MIRKILNNCLKYVQPPQQCALCLDTCEQALCAPCFAELPWVEHFCDSCGRGAAVPGICVACQQGGNAFDYCFAPLHYELPIKRLVSLFKFNAQLHQIHTLSYCFTQAALDHDIAMPELLLPVPAHPRRTWQRGFNQSALLTRMLSKRLQLPYSHRIIKRALHTPAQNQLTQQQRKRNLRGAFALKAPCPVTHVAIVDDVITTGSTANAIAELLKQSGVERVDIWCVCESVNNSS
jgi:ComF family protein